MGQIEIIPFDLTSHVESVLSVMAVALGLGDSGSHERARVVHRHAKRPGLITRGAFTADRMVGLCYGFTSDGAAWWEQQIHPHLVAAEAADWLDHHSFELTELHVHPQYQGRGVGRELITEVLDTAELPRALLSVRAGASPAHGLYASLGFRDLTSPFWFGPGQPPYVVMGATLPTRRPYRSQAAPVACADRR